MATAHAQLEQIDTLAQFVSRARSLYSLPAVVLEVLDLTSNPKVDIKALQDCIQNDPALTTRILKTVNSSLFGLNRRVASLGQALALIGTKPLKMLVLGFSLPKEMFDDSKTGYLSLYWRFSLTKAIASRRLMEQLWEREGDDAFLSGLLQDLGMLVLLQDIGEPYSEFLDQVRNEGADLPTLETATFGFDHTILSGQLLTHWNLPKDFVEEIIRPLNAEQLAEAPAEQKLNQKALYMADLLTRMLVFEKPDLLPRLLKAAEAFGDFTQQQVEGVVDTLQENVQEMGEIFSINLPENTSYGEVLAQAHQHLAELSADMLTCNNAGTSAEQEPSLGPGPLKASADRLRAVVNRYCQNVDPDGEGSGCDVPTEGKQLKNKKPGMPPPVINSIPNTTQQTGTSGKPATDKQRHETSLTDLALVGRVTAAISACRQSRSPLSVFLVGLDHYDQLVENLGSAGAMHYANLVKAVASSLCKAQGAAISVHDSCFTIILEGIDRRSAVEAGHHLTNGVERWSREREGQEENKRITVSVGIATVAMPPRNFPASELIEAANRCLGGVQLSGGNSVKSIEL